jgi:hypothetical protein
MKRSLSCAITNSRPLQQRADLRPAPHLALPPKAYFFSMAPLSLHSAGISIVYYSRFSNGWIT